MAVELLGVWLNDAYALEQAQIKVLEQQSQDFQTFPDVQTEIREHQIETMQHADDTKECLDKVGVKVSGSTSGFSVLTSLADGVDTSPFKDEHVKILLALSAAEHFEHVSYLALAAAARQAGEHDVADICERIAEAQSAMAEWVEEQIPAMVTHCLSLKAD